MKERKGFRYGIPILSGIAIFILVLLALVSPMVFYLALLVVGGLTIYNNILITNIYAKAKTILVTEKDSEMEKLDKPPSPPESVRAVETAKEYLEQGYTKEEIKEGLKEKYEKPMVDWIINQI